MRRSLGKTLIIGHATIPRLPLFAGASSYSSIPGGGRGRGRGSPLPPSSSDLDKLLVSGNSSEEPPSSPSPAMGHGRGKPYISSTPSFSSPGASISSPSTTISSGRGRGTILEPPQEEQPAKKKPLTLLKEDYELSQKNPIGAEPIREKPHGNILDVLVTSGRGRGKPSAAPTTTPKKEENRHIRAKQQHDSSGRGRADGTARLSSEEAKSKAMGILSKGGRGRGGYMEGRRGGRGDGSYMEDGRGGRGGGRGGRGRGGRGGRGQNQNYDESKYDGGLYVGDDKDGERFAQKMGPQVMSQLAEAFDEVAEEALPSPLNDALVNAYHTNLLLECEPEYLMADFESNPDIDEKPPISLPDAFEIMKPFLMAYEGIQSHEEWEEAVAEAMAQVPIMKEVVDYYSGPDRVTAKVQNEELQRVANTIPDSAPSAVKNFTNRALLSLQSNPGWGFDKKCQFMDKLAWEVQQQYK